jgi:hypothetical protein
MPVVVLGLPELEGKLAEIEAAMPGTIQTGLLAGGEVVATAAKDNLMAHGNWVTGTLGRSIQTVPLASGVGGTTVEVGTNVIYSRRIELGFTGADSLGRVYDQAPSPYLRPALDENRPRILEAIANAIRILVGA